MWPAKLQWAGNIRWKWWKDGRKSGQLALFMLVGSLAGKHASTPIPPLHPGRAERKGSLLFIFTQREQKSCKGSEDKRVCGGRGGCFRKCWVCWKGKGKVDKWAFMMHLLVLMTRNQENYCSLYSYSDWDLTNEYILGKEQSHPPAENCAAKGRPEPPTILNQNSFNCCCLREGKQGLGAGCKKERREW